MIKGESSPSTPVPLQIMRLGEEQETRNKNRELQIVDPNSAISSRFKLPNDWVVEKKPRVNSTVHPTRVDKYYCEPKTGRKFRSLISVQKYLSEDMRDALTPETVKPGNERNMQIVAHTFKSTSTFKLPNNWVIEEKLRRKGYSAGVIDKCYIEPGTGQRFRSLIAVQRYLTEMNEDSTTLKALKATCQSTKKHNSGGDENSFMHDFACPPAKVKWVLSGPGGNIWSPFMGESVVPESVKQRWSETFVISIQDKYECTHFLS